MKIKKKLRLRDLTVEEYKKHKEQICGNYHNCYGCPFSSINCGTYDSLSWVNNKNLFSDKFLDQEVEIEVPDILTKKEKEYLEVVLKILYENGLILKRLIKWSSANKEFEYIQCVTDMYLCNTIYFKKGTMFKNMELNKEYILEDLELPKEQKPESTSVSTEKKIALTDFWNSKKRLAIHCDTEEKANKLLKAFNILDKTWAEDSSYLKNNRWDDYKEETCYDNWGYYGHCDYYKGENYTIYEFDDVDLNN